MLHTMRYLTVALAVVLTLGLTANAEDAANAEGQTQDTTAQVRAAAPDTPRPMGRGPGGRGPAQGWIARETEEFEPGMGRGGRGRGGAGFGRGPITEEDAEEPAPDPDAAVRGRGRGGAGYGRGFCQGPFFEDEDEDGICDNYDPEAADQPGIGRSQGGPGYGRVWMDEDAENAAPMGRGRGGAGYGRGFCEGPFFEDEDGDGICDNYDPEAADQPGIGRGQGGPGYGRVGMDEDAENAAPMGWQGRGPRGAAPRQQQADPPRQMRPRAGQR